MRQETIYRGAALQDWLSARTRDVRSLDLDDFRHWLLARYDHWSRDPVFVQRTEIRDLRIKHPRLGVLEGRHQRRIAADAASPSYRGLQQLKKELADTSKAVAGLSGALQQAGGARRTQLRPKLAAYLAKQQTLRRQLGRLVGMSPERRRLLGAVRQLQQVRRSVGLDRAERQLAELLRQRGRQSGRRGESFEQQAASVAARLLIPDVTAADHHVGRPASAPTLLRGVTLAAARVELDQVIALMPGDVDEPAEVLAVVEVKRNINDLASGFRRRQDNLAWLTGDAAHYDAEAYRTRQFRSGHFDRPALHPHHGRQWVFTQHSFRHFRRDTTDGYFLDRLYFVSRDGPVWGLSSAAMHRISHRVATDLQWNPHDDAYLRRLQRWCATLAQPPETPDVLRMYLAAPRHADQILVIGPRGVGDEKVR